MKKIFLVAALAVVTSLSFGQVSFGIQAGANFAMGKFEYDDAYFIGTTNNSQKNTMHVGLLAGLVAEIPIGSQLAFRPELNFIQHGTKFTANYTDFPDVITENRKLTLNYIQLPLDVVYKMPVGTGTVFFGLGPVLEFGLSGKDKYSVKNAFDPTDPFTNLDGTKDVKFDDNKSDGQTDPNYYKKEHYKRFDIGANVLAGYKLDMGVFMKVGYSHGFMNLDPNDKNASAFDRSTYKNSGINVSVGYMFGGGSAKMKTKTKTTTM
ncbi:MAG: porin family protein [Ferruginibacter sp.]